MSNSKPETPRWLVGSLALVLFAVVSYVSADIYATVHATAKEVAALHARLDGFEAVLDFQREMERKAQEDRDAGPKED